MKREPLSGGSWSWWRLLTALQDLWCRARSTVSPPVCYHVAGGLGVNYTRSPTGGPRDTSLVITNTWHACKCQIHDNSLSATMALYKFIYLLTYFSKNIMVIISLRLESIKR